MKYLMLLLAVINLASCQRNSSWLKTVPYTPGVQGNPEPTPRGQPTAKASKVYDLAAAVVGEVAPPVDILWVIDNSGSMGNKQIKVSQNTSLFMENFTRNTKLKWKMGLLSTSWGDSPFVGFTPTTLLNYQTPNPVKVFQNAVNNLGTNGADNEESMAPILENLKKYPNFLTPDAYLALVFVSDEEEGSWDRPSNRTLTVKNFLDRLTALKGGDATKIVTYGVFSSTHNCGEGNFYYIGSRWQELMNATMGRVYSTCDPNFGQVLSNLGSDLVQKITTPHPVILLGLDVIASTLKVFYGGVELRYGFLEAGGQWIYDPVGNVIRITDERILVNTNKQVTVEFEYYP